RRQRRLRGPFTAVPRGTDLASVGKATPAWLLGLPTGVDFRPKLACWPSHLCSLARNAAHLFRSACAVRCRFQRSSACRRAADIAARAAAVWRGVGLVECGLARDCGNRAGAAYGSPRPGRYGASVGAARAAGVLE